jgi:hypothetical protein
MRMVHRRPHCPRKALPTARAEAALIPPPFSIPHNVFPIATTPSPFYRV